MIVTAVEYLNTLPMVSGIRSVAKDAINYELRLYNPAICAKKALEKKCDIALVPVGALGDFENPKIITKYCISATGKVDTVALISNTPTQNIKKIYLDTESRTSVQLCKILCRELWKIDPEFCDQIPTKLEQNEAMVAIGDKVFNFQNKFKYTTDLSLEWQKLTKLPFVFAVWIAVTQKGVKGEKELNKAIKFGVENIEKWLPDDHNKNRNVEYLTKRIEYELNPKKLQAIELFLSKLNPQNK